MPLTLENKKAIVAEVAKIAADATAAVIADYRGLKVSEMTKLRAKARSSGVYVRIVRNTLARKAVEGTEFDCIKSALVGPSVIAFSQEEPGAAARLIRDFAKEHENLKVTALAMSGKLLPAKDLEAIAKLPSRNEALASLMAVMKAPIGKFVRTMAEPHAKLVRTIAAVRDSKQA